VFVGLLVGRAWNYSSPYWELNLKQRKKKKQKKGDPNQYELWKGDDENKQNWGPKQSALKPGRKGREKARTGPSEHMNGAACKRAKEWRANNRRSANDNSMWGNLKRKTSAKVAYRKRKPGGRRELRSR